MNWAAVGIKHVESAQPRVFAGRTAGRGIPLAGLLEHAETGRPAGRSGRPTLRRQCRRFACQPIHTVLIARHFAHEREQIAVRVAKERHPQIVVRQPRDQVRLAFGDDAARDRVRNTRWISGTLK